MSSPQNEDGTRDGSDAVVGLAADVSERLEALSDVLQRRCANLVETLSLFDPRRQDLDAILKAVGETAALSQRLRALGGRTPLKPESIDLTELVGRMAKLIVRGSGGEIEVVTRCLDSEPTVLADRRYLDEVVLALAVQAHRAIANGHTITLETMAVDLTDAAPDAVRLRPGRYGCLLITHDGVLLKDIAAQLFYPDFTPRSELSWVYGIVRQSLGHISIDTSNDAGLSFRCLLPARAPGR